MLLHTFIKRDGPEGLPLMSSLTIKIPTLESLGKDIILAPSLICPPETNSDEGRSDTTELYPKINKNKKL